MTTTAKAQPAVACVGGGRGEGVEELDAYVPLPCHEKGDYS